MPVTLIPLPLQRSKHYFEVQQSTVDSTFLLFQTDVLLLAVPGPSSPSITEINF